MDEGVESITIAADYGCDGGEMRVEIRDGTMVLATLKQGENILQLPAGRYDVCVLAQDAGSGHVRLTRIYQTLPAP